MNNNTFTESTKTNAEQREKIKIGNINNTSTETTFTGGSKDFTKRSFEDALRLASRRVSEPESRSSETSE